MPRTKGSHVLSAVKLLRRNMRHALATLPPSLHKYLVERILQSRWYPTEDHLGLCRSITLLMPRNRDPWIELGRANASLDLNGVYRHLLRQNEPEQTLRCLGAIWRSVQDTGELVVSVEQPGCALVRLVGFPPGAYELCRVTMGYIIETLTLANATEIKVQHQVCRAQGANECHWRATWQQSSA
jgi:hypothetical protein